MRRMGSANATILRHRRRAYWSQNGRCFWCDELMFWPHEMRAKQVPGRRVSAEHLIPRKHKRERSDIDAPWNIVAACRDCNHERGDMPVDQWVLKIRARIGEAHFVAVLQKLATFGISIPIGHPAHAAPTVENPIVRAPEIDSPAPA